MKTDAENQSTDRVSTRNVEEVGDDGIIFLTIRRRKMRRVGHIPVSYTHLDVYKRQRIKWEVLQHPPYSPDLSPFVYLVFSLLNK